MATTEELKTADELVKALTNRNGGSPSSVEALLALLVGRVEAVESKLDDVIRPPGVDNAGLPFIIRVVRVTAADTPVQGPTIEVPAGYQVTVRQRRHSGAARTGRVAASQAELNNTLTRTELADGDSFNLPRVSNLNQIWCDTDVATTDFELITDYA